jgi:hypothetical protein
MRLLRAQRAHAGEVSRVAKCTIAAQGFARVITQRLNGCFSFVLDSSPHEKDGSAPGRRASPIDMVCGPPGRMCLMGI